MVHPSGVQLQGYANDSIFGLVPARPWPPAGPPPPEFASPRKRSYALYRASRSRPPK